MAERGSDREADAPQRGKRPKQGEPVIDRALSLLAVFTDRRRALTLSEMARHAGMPAPTALRLIARLVAWGALERLEDGRYVVGVRLWEVASLSPRGHGVREIALPYLEDLFAVTRHHVLLAVRDKNEAVLIERLSSKEATEVAYRVGGRAPLRSTAVGWCCWPAPTRRSRKRHPAAAGRRSRRGCHAGRPAAADAVRCPAHRRRHDPPVGAVADGVGRLADF